jgi:hypothetical protein
MEGRIAPEDVDRDLRFLWAVRALAVSLHQVGQQAAIGGGLGERVRREQPLQGRGDIGRIRAG